MKLNKIEFLAMNNWLRAFIQEHYEAPILRGMCPAEGIGKALEIGCGRGVGARIIKKYFNADYVYAVDIDDRMIRLAVESNRDETVSFSVQDAANLNFPDESFDAVFDFGIIHHIPDWRGALNEVRRVLKPQGYVIVEDLSIESFETFLGKMFRLMSDHPYDSMYRTGEFVSYLKSLGFDMISCKESFPLRFIRFFSLCVRLGSTIEPLIDEKTDP